MIARHIRQVAYAEPIVADDKLYTRILRAVKYAKSKVSSDPQEPKELDDSPTYAVTTALYNQSAGGSELMGKKFVARSAKDSEAAVTNTTSATIEPVSRLTADLNQLNLKEDNPKEAAVFPQIEGQKDAASVRHKQQRLLLLRHAAKCPYQGNQCPVTPHCEDMKRLWKHFVECKEQKCLVPHCVSSRYILCHCHRCKDAQCLVCSPVREVIHMSHEKQKDMRRHPAALQPTALSSSQTGCEVMQSNDPEKSDAKNVLSPRTSARRTSGRTPRKKKLLLLLLWRMA